MSTNLPDGAAAPDQAPRPTDDALHLLTDTGGHYFLVPAWLADLLRAPDALQALLNAETSADTGGFAFGAGTVDPTALVQFVLREAYQQNTEDLRAYAEQVKTLNANKQLIRDLLNTIH